MTRQRSDHVEPGTTETESARLLENEFRDVLADEGLADEQMRKLADTYVAETDGNPQGFLRWVRKREFADEVPSGGDVPKSG